MGLGRRIRCAVRSSYLAAAMSTVTAFAATALAADADRPLQLAPGVQLLQQQPPESVYAPPAFPTEEEGVNAGGVHLDLTVSYLTDYVFRGIERFDADISPEDAANLQVENVIRFDLGKQLPHPFVGVFVNAAESDEISNFQEVRPTVGADWAIRPFTFTAGHNTYTFPDREAIETSEVFGKLSLDDSFFLRSDEPLLSPYVYVAYDYDQYNGWYAEVGVEHDFKIEDTGIVLTAQASAAYVRDIALFAGPRGEETGFHHYRLGLIGTYSLNTLFNVSQRYGEWSLMGYLFYTDGIDNDLRADTGLYGGAGIGFRY